jgi:hypothetical protein
MSGDWLDEIEAQADETTPYYLSRLIVEIRRLRALSAPPVGEIERLIAQADLWIQDNRYRGDGPTLNARRVIEALKAALAGRGRPTP